MTVATTQDAIKAATSIARDVAEGKLDPAALATTAVATLAGADTYTDCVPRGNVDCGIRASWIA